MTDEETGYTENDSLATPEGVEQIEMVAEETGKEKCVKLGCGISAFIYLAAMFTAGDMMVYVGGGLSLILVPVIVIQLRKLTDLEAVKGSLDFMANQTKEFEKNNAALEHQVGELADTTNKLEEHEKALDMITATQGQNIDMLEKQVKENKKLLKQMEKNLKTIVLQNLLSVIIANDTDGDFKIDDDELEPMIEKLNEVDGVKLNAENFRETVRKTGGDISAVMDIIKGLLSDELKSPEEAIFIIEIAESEDSEDESGAQEESKDDEISPLLEDRDTNSEDVEPLG